MEVSNCRPCLADKLGPGILSSRLGQPSDVVLPAYVGRSSLADVQSQESWLFIGDMADVHCLVVGELLLY